MGRLHSLSIHGRPYDSGWTASEWEIEQIRQASSWYFMSTGWHEEGSNLLHQGLGGFRSEVREGNEKYSQISLLLRRVSQGNRMLWEGFEYQQTLSRCLVHSGLCLHAIPRLEERNLRLRCVNLDRWLKCRGLVQHSLVLHAVGEIQGSHGLPRIGPKVES